MTLRNAFALTLLLGAAPAYAGAQDGGDIVAALQPQFASVKIGSGTSSRTISQFTLPVVVVMPITSRLNFDMATSYARSEVTEPGVKASTISGLTDMLVRANYTLGNDAVVVTIGANLPTGQYKIPDDQIKAAGQIGNDFLLFPTSSYGSGFSTTGGIAVARSLGNWNVGIAGSFRKSTQFDAFNASDGTANTTMTFTPGDEIRARIGADRLIGNGRLALGVTYSTFGKDELANTSYATGSRYIGQASLFMPIGGTDVYFNTWGLYRAKGQQFGGVANPESLFSGAVSAVFHAGGLTLEPNVEGRTWQVDGAKAGLLANVGVRARLTTGSLTILPSASFQGGKLYSTLDGTSLDLTGWRLGVSVRLH
jgi:hypothetical protein